MRFFTRMQWIGLVASLLLLAALLGMYALEKRLAERVVRLMYAIPWEMEDRGGNLFLSEVPLPFYKEVTQARKEFLATLLRLDSSKTRPLIDEIFEQHSRSALNSYHTPVQPEEEWEQVWRSSRTYLEAYEKYLKNSWLVVGPDSVKLDFREAENHYKVLVAAFADEQTLSLDAQRYAIGELTGFELHLITNYLFELARKLDHAALRSVSKITLSLKRKQADEAG